MTDKELWAEFCSKKKININTPYEAWGFGGGEEDESFLDSAKREANEEAGIPYDYNYISLDSTTPIPVVFVTGSFSTQ